MKPKVHVKPVSVVENYEEPKIHKAPLPVSKVTLRQFDTGTTILARHENQNEEIMRRRQEKANNMCQAMFKSHPKNPREIIYSSGLI